VGNEARIAGQQTWESENWLLAGTGLGWLDELREKHIAAVRLWHSDVAGVVSLQTEIDEAARAWRRAVRDACAVGEDPPPGIDPAIGQARLEIAREDSVASRDSLSEVAIEALTELRKPERRLELEPHFGECSEGLRSALVAGPGGLVEQARAKLREQMERLDDGPPIADLSDPAQARAAEDDKELSHAR
jgi:hypothetical protein